MGDFNIPHLAESVVHLQTTIYYSKQKGSVVYEVANAFSKHFQSICTPLGLCSP
jgi:hypothetical protein